MELNDLDRPSASLAETIRLALGRSIRRRFPFSAGGIDMAETFSISRRSALSKSDLRIIAMALVLALTIALTACAGQTTGSTSGQSSGSGPAKTTGPSGTATGGKVFVTSLYPQYLAAAQIAKGVEGVSVVNLTGTVTGDLHDYQLTPGNMKTLERADAFIVNGGGIEDYLGNIVRDLPNLKVLNASEGIELTDGNPHVWVSISLMMKQVENIARGMGLAAPAHKDAFDQRARAYLARLQTLRDQMHATIDPLPKYPIVTVHEAFPYFAREFGLEIAGVIEREPESEPSAAELAATIRLIREKNVRAVFAEPQYPSAAAERVAREAGVRMYTLDPASMGDLDKLDTYLEIMEKNRLVLAEAFK